MLLLVFRVLMSKEAEECWLAHIVRTIEKVATFQRSFLHCATERVFLPTRQIINPWAITSSGQPLPLSIVR